jgi:hypothetical protein
MADFIEDYPKNPGLAIKSCRECLHSKDWHNEVDEDMIYQELSSPEFKAYFHIVL